MSGMERRRTVPAAGALALGLAVVVMGGAAGPREEGRTSGTEHWQGREIHYDLSGKASSDIRFSKTSGECHITLVVDGRERTVTLADENIDVDGERLDVGSYSNVALNAERDYLILNLVTTRSWSTSAASSTSDEATKETNTTKRTSTSRSDSSGKATDYHAFAFTSLGDMAIRARLTGGRSVDCSIVAGPHERTIRFDVDGGKNEGTVLITPGQVSVDGATRAVSDDAQVVMTATKRSLRVTADQEEVRSRD